MNERYRKRTTLNECQEHFKHLMKPLRENYYGEQIIDEDDFNNQQQQPPQQSQDNTNSFPQQQTPPENDMNQNAQEEIPPTDNMQANGQDDIPTGDEFGWAEIPSPPSEDFQNSEESEDDTDEIDVDDLTNAQEKLNKKMNAIGRNYGNTDKLIYSILKGISQITKKIDNDNGRIEALQKEIEKRNPTPIEKLNLRSVNDSYPFNSKPSEYWNDKMKKSNYRLTDNDNDGKEYHIYDTDLEDDGNIANSFDYDDDDLSLSNLL